LRSAFVLQIDARGDEFQISTETETAACTKSEFTEEEGGGGEEKGDEKKRVKDNERSRCR